MDIEFNTNPVFGNNDEYITTKGKSWIKSKCKITWP